MAIAEATRTSRTRRASASHRPMLGCQLQHKTPDRRHKRRSRALNRCSGDCINYVSLLDPACGSGNFLTETYLSLRKLENRVLEDLYGAQLVMGVFDPIQVTVDQFYGIEINDFAVEVAKTALWIAELQMLDQTREILSTWIDPLPLKTNGNIHEGNALRMDWNDVVPAERCSYIIGNPPFIGYSYLNDEQKADRLDICGAGSGFLDYVACWYFKAADYMADHPARAALVSTNSICQGQQV